MSVPGPDNVRRDDGSIGPSSPGGPERTSMVFPPFGPRSGKDVVLSVWEYISLRVGWVMWHLLALLGVVFGLGFFVGVNW